MPFGNPDRFKGFQLKTRSNKPTALDKLKTRKTTPKTSTEDVLNIINNLPLPDDVKDIIKKNARKSLTNKEKRSVSRRAVELKMRAEAKRSLDKQCQKLSTKTKQNAIKIFKELDNNARYQRRFVQGLKEIGTPHTATLEFILENWKEIVAYISSRDISKRNLNHFFYVTYGDNPPSKVNFLQIVKDVDEYFKTYEN